MTFATFAELLEDRVRKDADLPVRLKKLGVRPQDLANLLARDCHERVYIRFSKLLAKENLSPTPFQFARAKRELWGDADRLPDVTTHAQLGAIVIDLVKSAGKSSAIAKAAGLSGNRPLLAACQDDALPRLATEQQLLLAVLRHREGAPVPAKPAKPSKPTPLMTGDPWARLRQLAKREPKKYASPQVAAKLGISENRVRDHWRRAFNPDGEIDRKLVAAYPELAPGPAQASAASPHTPSTLAPAAPPQEEVGTPTVVASAMASFRAACNMLTRLDEAGAITDGERMNVFGVAVKLFAALKIDRAFVERLGKASPLNLKDLDALFGKK